MNYPLYFLLSLSFRWFIFEYKYTHFVRQFLRILLGDTLSDELFNCPYCQSIEAGAVVMGFDVLAGAPVDIMMPFVLLAVGFVGLTTAPLVALLVELVEAGHR